MAFDTEKLIKKNGRHVPPDGRGLSLYVRGNSALWVRQWRDAVSKKTKAHSLGSAKPGSAKFLNLTQARLKCEEHRLGKSPANGHTESAGKTFSATLEAYITDNASAWRGAADGDEAKAYRRLLALDQSRFAKLPIAAIDVDAVKRALAPWAGKPTLKKVRVKIKSVIDYAKAQKWFVGDNPAAHETLGKVISLAVPKAKPHDAMPWSEVPAFMKVLRATDTIGARALMWTILTAARSGETRGATWSEIEGDTWTIGHGRMKEGVPHSVPLSSQALALLGERGDDGDLIFGRVLLEDRALLAYVPNGNHVHGFRSTFTDWAAEHDYPSELREMSLAHAVGDETERAYRRTTMIGKRREMMQAWASFAIGGQS
jgi:integrase